MRMRAPTPPKRRQSPRLRQVMADLAVLAFALARRPASQERKVIERWLAAREKRA